MWLEDAITGDYTPFVNADVYRDVTMQTATPIHTVRLSLLLVLLLLPLLLLPPLLLTLRTWLQQQQGEQIYLRENFKELIETQAVNVIGPDAMDVGGLRELKVSTTACRRSFSPGLRLHTG